MKIRRNSKDLPEIFAKAKNIKAFSLENYFQAKPLADDPIDPEAWPKEVKHTTPQDYLLKTFRKNQYAILTRNNGKFTLHIHSNLWYEFESWDDVCPECGQHRPDDERVRNGMKCSFCAY